MCGTDYFVNGMSWFTAMECCYYNKGYLAEPQNQAEQDKIVQYITAGTVSAVQYCIVQYITVQYCKYLYSAVEMDECRYSKISKNMSLMFFRVLWHMTQELW